jgi:hypothetical protein
MVGRSSCARRPTGTLRHPNCLVSCPLGCEAAVSAVGFGLGRWRVLAAAANRIGRVGTAVMSLPCWHWRLQAWVTGTQRHAGLPVAVDNLGTTVRVSPHWAVSSCPHERHCHSMTL